MPLVLLGANYLRVYYPMQVVRSAGGYGLTQALSAFTPKGSVIIVAGDDWSAVIPYYSHRKALMIRNGLEGDPAYLDRALVRRVAAKFNLDPNVTFSYPAGDA